MISLNYDVKCEGKYNTYCFEVKYQANTWQVYDKETGEWLGGFLSLEEAQDSEIFNDYLYQEWSTPADVGGLGEQVQEYFWT